jgi:ankyrin repeat protein
VITPLLLACTNGNLAAMEALLKAGANPNSVNANGTAALMLAAASGNPDAAKVLLDHGAEVNAKETAHGQTALMFAAALNRAAVIKLLMAHGADASVATTFRAVEHVRVDEIGHVFYERASEKGGKPDEAVGEAVMLANAAAKSDLDLFSRALGFQSAQFVVAKPRLRPTEAGVRTGAEFVGGMTAARDGYVEAAGALLGAGADINQANADKFTPLLLAIINGHLDLAKFLLDHGADPNATTLSGLTALYATVDVQWAPHASFPQPSTEQERVGYLELMKVLIEHGEKVNAQLGKKPWFRSYFSDSSWVNPAGATAFWRAAQSSDIASMRLLIDHGADPKLATKGGVTPLMVAAGIGWGANWSVNAPAPPMEAVKYCVELGNEVTAVTPGGYTALHGAAYLGNNEIVTYLVGKGAKVDVRTKAGDSPADMANGPNRFAQPHPDTVVLLEELGSPNSHNCRSDQCVVMASVPQNSGPPLSPAAQAERHALDKLAAALGLRSAVYLAESR